MFIYDRVPIHDGELEIVANTTDQVINVYVHAKDHKENTYSRHVAQYTTDPERCLYFNEDELLTRHKYSSLKLDGCIVNKYIPMLLNHGVSHEGTETSSQ